MKTVSVSGNSCLNQLKPDVKFLIQTNWAKEIRMNMTEEGKNSNEVFQV